MVQAYRRYVDALVAGDWQRCRAEFEAWLGSGMELRTLYTDLIQRSLYEVGTLWESGRVSVATEHLATAITESLLNLVYPRLFTQPRRNRSAVVCCVANEFHQLGGKMVADLFELNGWRGYFLGANTPIRDLTDLLADKKPDVAVLSVTIYYGMDALLNAATEIRARFPALPILVGGQAFRWGGRERAEQITGVQYLPSLTELEAWMKTHGN
ncbi:MAG: cobalamin-dependent protein [Verrucomicrobia bacterium]|nr:cobalamin-dependent protein [Verrucomicrobiota bacterium]